MHQECLLTILVTGVLMTIFQCGDVSHVTNMERMFFGATNFNQDLSGWCVTKITSLPTDFATNSGLTEDKYPVWGTCPNGS